MSLSVPRNMDQNAQLHGALRGLSATQLQAIVAAATRLSGPSVKSHPLMALTAKDLEVPKKGKLGTTRPLNSWMAFRCFYATIFVDFQQKDISGYLTFMWQHDPFKAKWSILAKAYSVIRDKKGKANAPLDKFLNLNAPFIGLVPAEDYFVVLGWQVLPDEEMGMKLWRDSSSDSVRFDPKFLSTNISVEEVIKYTISCGYILDDKHDLIVSHNEGVMSMASSAQLNTTPSIGVGCFQAEHNANDSDATTANGAVTTPDDAAVDTPDNAALETPNDAAAVTPGLDTSSINSSIDVNDDEFTRFLNRELAKMSAQEALDQQGDVDTGACTTPTTSVAEDSAIMEEDAIFNDGEDLEYDPFGEYRFNAFNISDWVNDDAFENTEEN